MAVKHGPCLLTRKKGPGFRNQVPEETSLHLLLGAQDQRLGPEQNQLPCGSTGTSSGNCRETDTCMVRACHTPQQPLQKNHPSGHLGGWATPCRQKKCWMENIKEWTFLPMPELLTRAPCLKDWKRNSAASSLFPLPPPDYSIGHWTELNWILNMTSSYFRSRILISVLTSLATSTHTSFL